MQHMLVDDSPRYTLQQLGMRNRIEVFRQIGVNDIRVTLIQQLIYFLNRILRTSLRPVAVRIRLQIRLQDCFQDQLCGGLRHSVPNRWDTQGSLSPARLLHHDSSHRLWFIRLVVQVLPQAVQPLHHPLRASRFDILEAFFIHSRRSIVGLRQLVSVVQNIFAVHLVIELIEAVFRLLLRLSIQFDLQVPNFIRRCQTHRQSPVLSRFPNTPEARALPSTGITRLRRYI